MKNEKALGEQGVKHEIKSLTEIIAPVVDDAIFCDSCHELVPDKSLFIIWNESLSGVIEFLNILHKRCSSGKYQYSLGSHCPKWMMAKMGFRKRVFKNPVDKQRALHAFKAARRAGV